MSDVRPEYKFDEPVGRMSRGYLSMLCELCWVSKTLRLDCGQQMLRRALEMRTDGRSAAAACRISPNLNSTGLVVRDFGGGRDVWNLRR